VESVDHFIEDCSLYDITRERLRSELWAKAGIVDFSSEMLLVKKKEDQWKEWRGILIEALGDFISSTNRLKSSFQI